MRKITTILIVLGLLIYGCSTDKNNKKDIGSFDKLSAKKDKSEKTESKTADKTQPARSVGDYQSQLLAVKQAYPFNRWREAYDDGLTQYTQENCDKMKAVFDELIASLIKLGPNGGEEQKKELFKIAILKTNQLNEEIEELIESGEREDLCELTDKITLACGLDPDKYGDGEGLASEWRDW